jgi:hypothetical protein
VRIFKTKWFVRYARHERISDASLRHTIERAERGTVDAHLGCGVIKQRVARAGQGRSSGYRLMVAYRAGDRAVFLYGSFTASQKTSVRTSETMNWQR